MPSTSIEPELSVALALHSAPGAYALLLGSGISRAAGIPTGWEVVEDLIRRIAELRAPEAAAAGDFNPEAWYRDAYGREPMYTALLEQLAATPAERRALLRQYFEPTPAEREEGLKMPTKAHRAIARLVADGYVRVIITTNFDQLLETALRDEGVVPAVISTVDAIAGMMPLHLAPATIVKLHGDYLDTRIRNTQTELATYPAKLKALLGRILDEYGLIVAGWSGVWDEALRAALERTTSRRFTMFWAHRGALAAEALRLVEHRGAQLIAIDTADAFFEGVADRVATLAGLQLRHPLSLAVAVASLKRYLPDPTARIRLHDLLDDEAGQVIKLTREAIPANRAPNDWAEAVEVMRKLETSSETMTTLIATAGYWAEPTHRPLLVATIERLANGAAPPTGPMRSSYPLWSQLYHYPALRAFYAAGIGALARGVDGQQTVADLLLVPRIRLDRGDRELGTPGEQLYGSCVLSSDLAKQIPGLERRYTPASDHLFPTLREPLRAIIPDDATYADLFDRWEYYISLAYGSSRMKRGIGFWVPVGRYAWRHDRDGSAGMQATLEEIQAAGPNWFLIRRGLADGSLDKFRELQQLVQRHLSQLNFF